MENLPPREPIPEAVKRIVRQQAGFGCCKCGKAVFQYHHIVERSERPEDIMLLCPSCHDEATKKAMLLEEQIHYKQHPFNIQRGYADGTLKVHHKVPVMDAGSVQIIGEGDLITVDNESLLALHVDSDRLQISTKLYDSNGQLLVEIDKNEWISGDVLPWDIESSYQWLTIRHKERSISLDIDARKFPTTIRADLWFNGQNIWLGSSQMAIKGVTTLYLKNLCYVGIHFAVNTIENKISIVPDPRFDGGYWIARDNVHERIRAGISRWEEMSKTNIK